jgi:hypothetical protein
MTHRRGVAVRILMSVEGVTARIASEGRRKRNTNGLENTNLLQMMIATRGLGSDIDQKPSESCTQKIVSTRESLKTLTQREHRKFLHRWSK